jgi:3,5-epimerase/4-reductase
MTVLPDILPILIDMASKGITGTVNLVNPGLITHNEILEMYRDIVDPNFKWKNFTLEDQGKILAGGRSNNYLDTTILKKMYPDVKNIKDAIRDVLYVMKDNKIK